MSQPFETGRAAATERDCPRWAPLCGWVMTSMGIGAGAGGVMEAVSGHATPYMGIGMLMGGVIGWFGYKLVQALS